MVSRQEGNPKARVWLSRFKAARNSMAGNELSCRASAPNESWITLEDSLNQEKWRIIEGRPQCRQRTSIKRVWPTRRTLHASLRCKLVPKRRISCVQTDRSLSSQRKISFEKFAARSSRAKYPLMRKSVLYKMFSKPWRCLLVCCRLLHEKSVRVGYCPVSV